MSDSVQEAFERIALRNFYHLAQGLIDDHWQTWQEAWEACDAGHRVAEEHLAAGLAAAEEERDGLRADAERFRWIEEHALTIDMVGDPDNFVQIWHETLSGNPVAAKTLREAVDIARKKKP